MFNKKFTVSLIKVSVTFVLDDRVTGSLSTSPSFLCATTKGTATQQGAKITIQFGETGLGPHFIFNFHLNCPVGNFVCSKDQHFLLK